MRGEIVWTLRRYPAAVVGTSMIAAIVLAVAAAPLLSPAPPAMVDLAYRLTPPGLAHPFGADLFGRDVLARVLYGGRYTLAIGVVVTAAALTIGSTVGVLAGFFGGAFDMVAMRLVDAMLSFPALILAIALAAAFGPSLINAMTAIAIAQAPQFARLARTEALSISRRPYVEAAIAAGVSTPRILIAYVLRNILPPLLTQAPLSAANAILQVTSLGFLGLGAQPPTPEWGADIASNLEFVRDAPWVAAAPGLAILITVLAFNLIGDCITEAMTVRRRSPS